MLIRDAIDEYVRVQKGLQQGILDLSPGLKARIKKLEEFILKATGTTAKEFVMRKAFFPKDSK